MGYYYKPIQYITDVLASAHGHGTQQSVICTILKSMFKVYSIRRTKLYVVKREQ